MRRRCIILTLAVSLLSGSLFAAGPGDAPVSFGMAPPLPAVAVPAPEARPGQIPGGIADAEWKRAFVPGLEGVVEAIDLATGKTLFASATRAQPIALAGDRVYVLAPSVELEDGTAVVRVLAMSIKGQGKYDFASKPLPLPEWVANNKARWILGRGALADGKLTLDWRVSGAEASNSGVAMMRARRFGGEMASQNLNAAGTFTIDLATGEAKVSETPAADPAEEGAPDGWANRGTTVLSANSAASRWKAEAVSHAGLNYALGFKFTGDPVLTCFDTKTQRTLWQRTLDRSPGSFPAPAVAAPLINLEAERIVPAAERPMPLRR